MAEDLIVGMEMFALSSNELNESEIVLEDMSQGIRECSRSLIGKAVGNKKTNYDGMRKFGESSWGCIRKLKIVEIGPNMFQFSFEIESEMERVLNSGPWLFDNQLLILKQWYEGIEEDNKAFNKASFWIQLWNLFLHGFSKDIGIKIGVGFEEVK